MNQQTKNNTPGENAPIKSETMNKQNAPEALMLLSSHCAHCPGVLESLCKLVKNGDIGHLQIINLEQRPEAMQTYNVRSVPWVRIGQHELTGAQTLEALKQRAEWALKENNLSADFDFLLSDGQVNKVIESIQKDESAMQAIMELLGNSGTVLSTRIGIGVVFEEYAGSDLLISLIPELKKLTQHKDERIRADAYHYLGMTGDESVINILQSGLDDSDQEVREIASDALEELKSKLKSKSR